MSLHQTYWMACDAVGCNSAWAGPDLGTGREVRAAAARERWVHVPKPKPRDFCPKHYHLAEGQR